MRCLLRSRKIQSISGLHSLANSRLSHTCFSSSPQIDFYDEKTAFGSLSTFELVRALSVYKICGFSPIVNNAGKLLKLSSKVFGLTITHFVIRHTFFAHFCAGESATDIKPVISRLESNGIHSILDYAAEADLEHLETTPGIIGRSYDTDIDETECNANMEVFLKCIDAASQFEDGFAAVKVSGLGRPELLEALADIIDTVRNMFNEMDLGKAGELTYQEFSRGITEMGVELSEEHMKDIFIRFDTNGNGKIDLLEWTEYLKIEDIHTRPFFTTMHNSKLKSPLPNLTFEQLRKFENLVKRLDTLAKRASEKNVRLMIDAEQTYFQSGIDHVVMNLQRKYNKNKAVVFSTHQAYLKNCHARLLNDINRAKNEGYIFATKVVRGAYMVAERKRASEKGIPDPIQPDVEATHASYRRCIDSILENNSMCELMVASHNEASITYTTSRMQELGIPKRPANPGVGGVYFGQLLGMSDHISYTLGNHGFRVFKYVPFGPVDEVIPYLIRRAEENGSILHGAGVQKQRRMLWNELKRRINLFSSK